MPIYISKIKQYSLIKKHILRLFSKSIQYSQKDKINTIKYNYNMYMPHTLQAGRKVSTKV